VPILATVKTLIVIGGGAAGFFGAINAAQMSPGLKVTILEKSSQLLGKVKVSGGGRCNVTHACFDPRELVTFYPRGERELLGPFNKFQPGDTIAWFAERGVELKIEGDGRMFPITNLSQTIIDCFLTEAKKFDVVVKTQTGINSLQKNGSQWEVTTTSGIFTTDYILMAAGSSNQIWELLKESGHEIVEPVPSLFTFNIDDSRIKNHPGISVPNAEVHFGKFFTSGPLLITHWGLSGPAILKMSALAAIEMNRLNYKTKITINWDGSLDKSSFEKLLRDKRQSDPKKLVLSSAFANMPLPLWKSLLSDIPSELKWADCNNERIAFIAESVTKCEFDLTGKSTFKEEFVTAGGIELKEIDFRTMESRVLSDLYFAGEVLNIDAVTGGFNFQAAWTTSWIAASAIAKKAGQIKSTRLIG